jgi:hypothetical protein
MDCNTNSNQNEINLIQSRMDELLHREELMWMQRSRIKWLREGDKKYKLLLEESFGSGNKEQNLSLEIFFERYLGKS